MTHAAALYVGTSRDTQPRGQAEETPMTNPAPSSGSAPGAPPNVATSSSGLAPNVAGALAYVLGIITGVIFLVIEKENRFVRFHAAQSIAVTLGLAVVSIA